MAIGPPPKERLGMTSSAPMLVVDFVPQQDAGKFDTLPLDDDDVAAMFLNNRAAEALVAGRIDDAYWWARAAILKRPSALQAYNTLAVVYQRHGDLALAEKVYRAALMREPENLLVLRNLQPVLAALGKHAEAQALVRQLSAIEPTPPSHYFHLGVKAYERGWATPIPRGCTWRWRSIPARGVTARCIRPSWHICAVCGRGRQCGR
jgi:tetratricopeptide (TPR) repeat protein